MFSVDLTPSSGTLSTAEDIQLAFNAWAVGDNLGVATYGLQVYVWDDGSGAFLNIGSNTASSRAAGGFSLNIDPGFRTSANRLYFLLKSSYGKGATSGSALDLDLSSLSITVPTLE
jgi:hypothetical protein